MLVCKGELHRIFCTPTHDDHYGSTSNQRVKDKYIQDNARPCQTGRAIIICYLSLVETSTESRKTTSMSHLSVQSHKLFHWVITFSLQRTLLFVLHNHYHESLTWCYLFSKNWKKYIPENKKKIISKTKNVK